jgi:hypothetical protein
MTSIFDSNANLIPFLEAKAEEINLVLSEPDVDLWKLRALALSEGGLVNGTCFIALLENRESSILSNLFSSYSTIM